jgi:vitamin B12 transporter
LDRACPIATGANMTRIIDKSIAGDTSRPTSRTDMPRSMRAGQPGVWNRGVWTTSSLLALAACAAIAPSPADAQLATSPDVIRLPGITVTAPAPAPARPRPAPAAAADDDADDEPETAPRAAQQTSRPRASRPQKPTPAPIASTPAPLPSDATSVTVAPTGITQPVERSGSAVTVIGGAEIEARQARNAPELLATVPGLTVVQTGGAGGKTSIFTRGTNANHTKVFIDGIDVTNPFDADRAFDFGLLTTFDIGRVEVLRGPQSGLYGADPIGGVIVLYTKDGEGPLKMEAVTEGGAFGTFNQAVGARGSTGRFRYSFNVSHTNVDAVTVTPRRILPTDGSVPVLQNAYENWTFATKLGVDLSPFLAVNVAARYLDTETRFQSDSTDPVTFALRTDGSLSSTRSDQLYARGETVLSLYGGRLKSIAGLNYTEVDSETITPNSGTTVGVGTRVKADWRTIAEVMPGLTVVGGADWQNERLTQPGLAVEEASAGVYAQATVEPVQNLFLTANVRHDDNENFGDVTTWRLSPTAVVPDTGTTFRASFGTAYKAPSLSQRFQDFPAFFFFANRNLRPEESRGMDVGFEQALAGGRARAGLTYFRNSITDLIEFKFDPNTFTSTVENVGEARTSGIEVFASADLSDTVRLRGDYTYTEAINQRTGADLLRRPRHKASLAVGWQALPPLLVTTSLLYVGERFDIDRQTFATVRQPSFVTVNIAADYKLSENMSLIGRIDNLFDERYEDPNGFLRPGLGAYAGVRVRN